MESDYGKKDIDKCISKLNIKKKMYYMCLKFIKFWKT